MKKVRIKRSRKRASFPSPAFLPGVRGSAEWHVRPADKGETPHTINNRGGKAEMALPMGDEPIDSYTHLHEMLHAAHSPVEQPRPVMKPDGSFIRVDAMMIAEEFRINLYSRYLLGNWEALPDRDELDRQHLEQLCRGFEAAGTASALIEILSWVILIWPTERETMSTNSQGYRTIHAATTNGIVTSTDPATSTRWLLEQIWYTIWPDELDHLYDTGEIPTWAETLKLAEFLSTYFDLLEHPEEGDSAGDGEEEDPDIQRSRDRMGQPRLSSTLSEKVQDRMRKKMPKMLPQKWTEGPPIWQKMKTRVAKLTKKLPKNKMARSKYRATDEGANPRYPHRLLTDRKVFSRKKRSNGGTVLIDDSGSMSWSTEELVQILEEAPAANIAAYSGGSAKGELVILAKDGKYADMTDGDNHPFGGNNLVDLPALEWLASQPAPRIWVSDTQVTILRGDPVQAYEDCIQLCKDYGINIVLTPEEAGEVFRGERTIYR